MGLRVIIYYVTGPQRHDLPVAIRVRFVIECQHTAPQCRRRRYLWHSVRQFGSRFLWVNVSNSWLGCISD